MTERPGPTPEGELLRLAREERKLQVKEAAQRAGISDSRWGQIERGYEIPRRGQYLRVEAPPETLAQMAHVVGVTPEELESAGRRNAADDLRLILSGQLPAAEPRAPRVRRQAPAGRPADLAPESVLTDPDELQIYLIPALSPAEKADQIATMRARRATAPLLDEIAELRRQLNKLRQQLEHRRAG